MTANDWQLGRGGRIVTEFHDAYQFVAGTRCINNLGQGRGKTDESFSGLIQGDDRAFIINDLNCSWVVRLCAAFSLNDCAND